MLKVWRYFSLCNMRKIYLLKPFCFILILLLSKEIYAQQKASIDFAATRNMSNATYGLNLSGFYHFSERIVGGLEVNRFFPITRKLGEEDVEISAWDFDLNFHYNIPLAKKLIFYPLTGVSHTSDKEFIPALGETVYSRFYSFNTGAGLFLEGHKIVPYVECNLTWGKINQQFLLAGFSYELEWGHHSKEKE